MATFRRLDGLNAIAALDVRSGCLAAAKSGSPMTLGWASDGMLLASDYAALLEHTRRMTFLDESQAALLTPDGIAVRIDLRDVHVRAVGAGQRPAL